MAPFIREPNVADYDAPPPFYSDEYAEVVEVLVLVLPLVLLELFYTFALQWLLQSDHTRMMIEVGLIGTALLTSVAGFIMALADEKLLANGHPMRGLARFVATSSFLSALGVAIASFFS